MSMYPIPPYSDVFPNDPDMGDSGPEPRMADLPQFGPAFVPFVHERFNRLEGIAERLLKRWEFEPVTVVHYHSLNTAANGAVNRTTRSGNSLYEPPPGFTFALHRFVLSDIAHDFGTPYTAAGSWWELRVNGAMIYGASMVSGSGQLPVIAEWGTRDAPRVRDGEYLEFRMASGPASTKLDIILQGTLDRTVEG